MSGEGLRVWIVGEDRAADGALSKEKGREGKEGGGMARRFRGKGATVRRKGATEARRERHEGLEGKARSLGERKCEGKEEGRLGCSKRDNRKRENE